MAKKAPRSRHFQARSVTLLISILQEVFAFQVTFLSTFGRNSAPFLTFTQRCF